MHEGSSWTKFISGIIMHNKYFTFHTYLWKKRLKLIKFILLRKSNYFQEVLWRAFLHIKIFYSTKICGQSLWKYLKWNKYVKIFLFIVINDYCHVRQILLYVVEHNNLSAQYFVQQNPSSRNQALFRKLYRDISNS